MPTEAQDLTVFVQSVMEQMVRANDAGGNGPNQRTSRHAKSTQDTLLPFKTRVAGTAESPETLMSNVCYTADALIGLKGGIP